MTFHKLSRCLLFGMLTSLLLLRGDEAQAHLPNILRPGEVFQVPDPLLSFALYGTFSHADDVFEVRLQPETPLAVPIEIMVPRQDALTNHRPLFAIVGKGLPKPSATELAQLPRPLPDGMGVVLGRYEREDREILFESFSRRVLYTNGVVAYVLPAGDVRMWVWSPSGTTGKFVLGLGVEEGKQDFGNLIANWGDYAY